MTKGMPSSILQLEEMFQFCGERNYAMGQTSADNREENYQIQNELQLSCLKLDRLPCK